MCCAQQPKHTRDVGLCLAVAGRPSAAPQQRSEIARARARSAEAGAREAEVGGASRRASTAVAWRAPCLQHNSTTTDASSCARIYTHTQIDLDCTVCVHVHVTDPESTAINYKHVTYYIMLLLLQYFSCNCNMCRMCRSFLHSPHTAHCQTLLLLDTNTNSLTLRTFLSIKVIIKFIYIFICLCLYILNNIINVIM